MFSSLIHFSGLLTAGLVWLDFYNTKDFQAKASELHGRICDAVGDLYQQSKPQDSTPKIKPRSTFIKKQEKIPESPSKEPSHKTSKYKCSIPSKKLTILFFFAYRMKVTCI